jgi:replicative DNA helicase
VEHIASILGTVWEDLKVRQASNKEFPGISTGLVDLDRRISGLNNSDLVILAARPAMGKTSLALNIALEAGKHSGKSVAIFSLEMSREQVGMRLISSECFIDSKKLVTGRLDGADDWARVAAAVAALSQSRIYIDDDSSLSVADMNAKCRRIRDLGLVVIDYLQLMTSSGKDSGRNENRQGQSL